MKPSADWNAWLETHGPALVLLARQYAPTRADAEDIVQEAFVRFWRSRQRAADATAYLFGCVRGVALEWLRSTRRRRRREAVAARPESLFASSELHAERLELIECALRDVPTEQREVLVLKLWGGLSFERIATALSIPLNTAASRYRYAVKKLRASLAPEAVP